MAVYDFKCGACERVEVDVVLPMTHVESDRPQCCGSAMATYITTPPMTHFKDYELKDGGFVAHGMPGAPTITSLKQNRELMRRHNLIDANDLYKPPTHGEQLKERAEAQAAIDGITPTSKQEQQLKACGILD